MSRKAYLLLALFGLAVLADALARQYNGDGGDFNCYYQAGARFLRGEPLYVDTYDRPYKYPPIVALYFIPYALMPIDVARWIWAIVHTFLIVATPLLVVNVLRHDSRFRDLLVPKQVLAGLAVAFLGSMRFLDGELMVSQVTLTAYLGLPVAAWLVTTRRGKLFAPAAMALGCVVKVHSLAAGLSLAPERSKKTAWAVVAVVAVLLLIPDPRLWLAWVQQMRVTTAYIPLSLSSINLQGFYPFGVIYFGLPQMSILPALAAIPFAAIAWLRLPRFTLDEAGLNPTKFLLATSTWFLLGVLVSPLPWQYTYAVLWPMLLLSWIVGTRRQRWVILAIALSIGLTPQGIIGKSATIFIEGWQSQFFVLLAYWVLLWRQAAVARETAPKKSSLILVEA